MSSMLFLLRSVLSIGLIGAMLTGCGGAQPGSGALPQNAPGYVGSEAQPDLGCPIPGRKYYTGKGHFWLTFASAKFTAGEHWRTVAVHFHFVKWPFGKELPDWSTFLTTCGPQSGQKPVGKIIERGLHNSDKSCHNGVCEIYFDDDVLYEPPVKLDKAFRYDSIAFTFKAKGWGTLKGAQIEIVK